MKITAESTSKVVSLKDGTGAAISARIWEAVTDGGVKCHLYVTRVAVAEGQPPETYAQFEQELKEQRKPSPEIQALPLSMIL